MKTCFWQSKMSKALFRPAEMYQVPSSAWECVRVWVRVRAGAGPGGRVRVGVRGWG